MFSEEAMGSVEIAESMATIVSTLIECEAQNEGTQQIINDCIKDAFIIMRASLRKAVLEHAMPEMK